MLKNERINKWHKISALGVGGIISASIISFVGWLGTDWVENLQRKSQQTQLYTQLLSEQEKSEHAIRKDMFTMILTSFLSEDEVNSSECCIDKFQRQLLELEMISRNFHESIDLQPLFMYILKGIVQDIHEDFIDINKSTKIKDINDTNDRCKNKLLRKLKRVVRNSENNDLNDINVSEGKKILVKEYKERLIAMAKRITQKQLESLISVSKRIRLNIELNKTCKKQNPFRELKECNEIGFEMEETLSLGKNIERKFKILSKYSYPKWGFIHLTIDVNKSKIEIENDKNGSDRIKSEFWLNYFDFPLVDNTFISPDERYAVILDDINESEANLSLLYFPASYAGFKEKSYYQYKIINNFLKNVELDNNDKNR